MCALWPPYLGRQLPWTSLRLLPHLSRVKAVFTPLVAPKIIEKNRARLVTCNLRHDADNCPQINPKIEHNVGGADVYFGVVFHHAYMGISTEVPISTMWRRRATTSHHIFFTLKRMIAYFYFLRRDMANYIVTIWTNPRRYSDIDKRSKSCTSR